MVGAKSLMEGRSGKMKILIFIFTLITLSSCSTMKCGDIKREVQDNPLWVIVNPNIRDTILLLIGNKTFEELEDLQGKKQLKAELTSKINSFLKSLLQNDRFFGQRRKNK